MFSLVSAVNAANIDKVCGEDKNFKNHIYSNIYVDSSVVKKLISHHSKEFKIDDKESVCVYMNVYDLSFLNTQLTQSDIEQFERYMAENGRYDDYEESKEYYYQVLKLYFTHYRSYSYKKENIGYIDRDGNTIKQLKFYNGEIRLYRYVYGKRQGYGILWSDSFDDFKERVAKETTCSEATANSKEELVECTNNKKVLPAILQWAESNMKQ